MTRSLVDDVARLRRPVDRRTVPVDGVYPDDDDDRVPTGPAIAPDDPSRWGRRAPRREGT